MSDDGPSLFDWAEGQRQRDKAIERVGDGAPVFVDVAVAHVARIALINDTLTTDDVWAALAQLGVEAPREPRAMGAVMRKAQSLGYIEPTSDYRLSKRPACHRRPLRVWRRA